MFSVRVSVSAGSWGRLSPITGVSFTRVAALAHSPRLFAGPALCFQAAPVQKVTLGSLCTLETGF